MQTSPIIRAQLVRTFFEEVAEHIATLETSLLELERAPSDAELLGKLFRAAHSIKGGARIVGMADVGRFTHLVESLLDQMRQGHLVPTPPHIDLLLRATDRIDAMVRAAAGSTPTPWPAELEAELAAIVHTAEAPTRGARPTLVPVVSFERSYHIRFVPTRDALRAGVDPLALLRQLGRRTVIERIEPELAALPPLGDLDPRASYLGWQLDVRTALDAEAILAMFQPAAACGIVEVTPATAAAATPSAAPRAQQVGDGGSIRVSVEKADTLVNLVGELVIHQAMVSDLVRNFSQDRLARLAEAVAGMERSTRELQERVLAIRMVPVGAVLHRVPRIVRDLAASLGKQVELELYGDDTELDKSMVEQLADPLMHLVRNAVDHGIELPDVRRVAGKTAHGRLRIAASHQGGNITIEVRDDGRGLDAAKIRQKAIASGLISADDELSDAATFKLILRPGFSTAEAVTDVSGRGVGLDVVKRNIEALHGSIEITSEPGAGACFQLTLPLTLAILDGMSLRIADSAFVLPLATIVESIRVRPGQLRRVLGKGELLDIRGESLPLIRLHRLFEIAGAIEDPTRGLVVIVEHDRRRVGLLVDEITGQPQVVIKSLERHYRKVDGLMGATILGDGHVTLILDVPGLIRRGHGLGGAPEGARHAS